MFIIDKAIRIVKDIPGDLRAEFIDRLDGLKEGVLSDILTDVNMRTCPVRDAEDFLEKMGEHKTRILFRELRKREQSEIVAQWMRKKFPAGSTGRFLTVCSASNICKVFRLNSRSTHFQHFRNVFLSAESSLLTCIYFNQGPMKSDDELSAGEMNYGYRREITKILTGKFA